MSDAPNHVDMMFNVFLQSCICMIKCVFLNHTFYPWSTFLVILSSSNFLLLCVEQSECTFINHTCLLPIGVKYIKKINREIKREGRARMPPKRKLESSGHQLTLTTILKKKLVNFLIKYIKMIENIINKI